MLTAVWQSTILALAVAAVTLRWKRSTPSIRYWLWQVVALKLLILPVWTATIPIPDFFPRGPSDRLSVSPSARIDSSRVDPSGTNAATGRSDRDGADPRHGHLAPIGLVRPQSHGLAADRPGLMADSDADPPGLPTAIAAGPSPPASDAHRRSSPCNPEVAELRRSDWPETGPGTQGGRVRGLAVRLRLVASPAGPAQGLTGSIEPDRARQVLAHELAHVKRADLFWDWFPAIARMLFFFHPVAHWAAGRILLERELACDQIAMNLSDRGPAHYARMLVRVTRIGGMPLARSVDRRIVRKTWAGQSRVEPGETFISIRRQPR